MRRDTFKLLILAAIVGFAILYGMELASSGITTVYGPMETPAVREDPAAGGDDWNVPVRRTDRSTTEWPAADPATDPATDPYGWNTERPPLIPRNDHKPIVDRISGKAGEALHGLSSGGIKFIVSLFDKVTGS